MFVLCPSSGARVENRSVTGSSHTRSSTKFARLSDERAEQHRGQTAMSSVVSTRCDQPICATRKAFSVFSRA